MKKWAATLLLASAMSVVSVSDTTSFTVHIVGDSTVCNYASGAYPQTGWGQIIGSFFDGSRVKINNAAIGGRSSKTFIQDGRLESVKASMQAGDFLLIQFGHNDRYFGNSSRQVPYDSLGYWLQQYVDAAKEVGATPIFVTPMNMNMGTDGRNIFTEYDVVGKMLELSKSNGVPYVDLNSKSYNAYSKTWNAAYVSRYQFKYFLPGEYPNYSSGVLDDNTTHFQESGSIAHSQWIVEELENALNESYLSTNSKTELTKLVSAIKPRYAFTVKSNVSNSSGLITHNQNLPGDAPLTLHVSPGSFGKAFKGWYDDDCNLLSTDSNYYGQKTLYRASTYTAVFDGGSACTVTAHGEEEIPVSSSEESSSSENAESSSSSSICSKLTATEEWKSPIDMVYPEEGMGTTDKDHVGYTGLGFYNIYNELSSVATFKLQSIQSASNAKLLIRYSNGGTESRPMKLTVDYGTYEVDFPPTADWDTWDTVYVEDVWIDAVPFNFTIESLTANGGPNIDMIAFNIGGVSREGCEPCEDPSDKDGFVLRQSVVNVSFDMQNLKITTPGGLLKVTVVDALGQRVMHVERYVKSGEVDLLPQKESIPQGRFFANVSLNGKMVGLKPFLVKSR
ncbi:MAG: GDSL family lipase [Fibrobacter sp.]|nr:GDSL family lipase [Fibrobacter sp.]